MVCVCVDRRCTRRARSEARLYVKDRCMDVHSARATPACALSAPRAQTTTHRETDSGGRVHLVITAHVGVITNQLTAHAVSRALGEAVYQCARACVFVGAAARLLCLLRAFLADALLTVAVVALQNRPARVSVANILREADALMWGDGVGCVC